MSFTTLLPRGPPHGLLVLAALVASLGTGCRGDRSERLVVGAVRIAPMALLYVAEDLGCFGGDGPRILVRDYPTGRDAMAALRGGEVDVAAAYETPVVLRSFEEPALRILTTLHTATRSTHLTARSDRGIRTAADLRGKRVGVPSGTNAEFFLRALLVLAGVDPEEVVLVDIVAGQAAAELSSGRVDAVVVWSPHADDAAAALPPRLRVEVFSDAYTEASMLVTKEEIRSGRRAALTKLVACVVQAQQVVDEAPDAALSIAQRVLGEPDEARLRRLWQAVTHQIGLQNALALTLTQEAEWLRPPERTGAAVPQFAAMFAPEFLEASAPEAVTYVRRAATP